MEPWIRYHSLIVEKDGKRSERDWLHNGYVRKALKIYTIVAKYNSRLILIFILIPVLWVDILVVGCEAGSPFAEAQPEEEPKSKSD